MRYSIFLDMDGVLVDLASNIESFFNITLPEPRHSTEKHPGVLDWLKMVYAREVNFGIFIGADKLSDADTLWSYVSEYREPQVLSSTGPYFIERIRHEKYTWMREMYGPEVPVTLVSASHLKARYANPTSILVDDQPASIEPWRKAGGIGILHTSASDTIEQLQVLGI